jgi:hypothetical protein
MSKKDRARQIASPRKIGAATMCEERKERRREKTALIEKATNRRIPWRCPGLQANGSKRRTASFQMARCFELSVSSFVFSCIHWKKQALRSCGGGENLEGFVPSRRHT